MMNSINGDISYNLLMKIQRSHGACGQYLSVNTDADGFISPTADPTPAGTLARGYRSALMTKADLPGLGRHGIGER